MERVFILALSLAVALWIWGLSAAAGGEPIQGRGATRGQGKATKAEKARGKVDQSAKKGKPAEKGLERAEAVTSPQGVQHGIAKAKAKQAAHSKSEAATPKGHKGKHIAKGKKSKRAGAR